MSDGLANLILRDKVCNEIAATRIAELLSLIEEEGGITNRNWIMGKLGICTPDVDTLLRRAMDKGLIQKLDDGSIACPDYGSLNWLGRIVNYEPPKSFLPLKNGF